MLIMVTEIVGTVLILIVFMIAFVYYLQTLVMRRIEKAEKARQKNAGDHHDQPASKP